MVARKEIIMTDTFVRAMSNCRKHFYTTENTIFGHKNYMRATASWQEYLKEFTISWGIAGEFLIEDEGRLSLFIVKWV